MDVSPIESDPKYGGYGWCAFLTLATIRSGDPCTYATYYEWRRIPLFQNKILSKWIKQ